MMEHLVVGAPISKLILIAVLSAGSAPLAVPTPNDPMPFLPAQPLEVKPPPWGRTDPRRHYRQRRPGRSR